MTTDPHPPATRRDFLKGAGLVAGGALLAAAGAGAEPAAPNASRDEIPRRILGRTNVPVTTLTLGTAPSGQSNFYKARDVAAIVDVALEEGINFIDTARIYGSAEEGIGLALGRRRKEVFLATKIWADTIEDAEKSFSKSLSLMKTDAVDLLYFHQLGHRDVRRARQADGVFTWILKQKKLGKTRFIGVSGHSHIERFPDYITSGDVDVLLLALNFVDRYTYKFEEKVLPLARRHNLGVVAMKVFGGIRGGFANYGGPKAPSQLDPQHLELAIRYSLGLPGVTTLNIGVHDAAQLRQNVAMVKRFRPLSTDEQVTVEQLGRELAAKWGPHLGPVGEKGE